MSRMISLIVIVSAACGSTPESEPVVARAPIATAPDKPRISCDADVDIHCPDGYEDGCGGGRTTFTVCVKKGATAEATCDSQLMLSCPTGEINSCFARPPYGNKHICVRPGPAPDKPDNVEPVPPAAASPRISCEAEIEILCPDGYENGCGGGRTTAMACVKKGAIAVASCDAEIALRCPAGEVNSCFAKPPYGDKQICVRSGP